MLIKNNRKIFLVSVFTFIFLIKLNLNFGAELARARFSDLRRRIEFEREEYERLRDSFTALRLKSSLRDLRLLQGSGANENVYPGNIHS